jgi:hypothetical protein
MAGIGKMKNFGTQNGEFILCDRMAGLFNDLFAAIGGVI